MYYVNRSDYYDNSTNPSAWSNCASDHVEGIKLFKKSTKVENNKIQQSWAKKINSTTSIKPHTILIKAKG